MKKLLFILVVFGVLLLLAVGVSEPAAADTAAAITVDTTADVIDSSGDCSLREAILAANADVPIDGCAAGSGRDIVVVPAGTYTLARAGREEDSAWTGDLDILDDISIIGGGFSETTIDAAGLDNVFHLPEFANAEIAVIGVTVRNGKDGFLLSGTGRLELFDSRVMGNSESGIDGDDPGAVEILLDGSRIDHNSSRGISNSAENGETLIVDSLIDHNQGGGISLVAGLLTVTNSTISHNKTLWEGGGILVTNRNFIDSTIKLYNVTIFKNEASANDYGWPDGGGGVYIDTTGFTFEMKNTIIAGNIDWGDTNDPKHDCGGYGVLTSQGYNLIQDPSGCTIRGNTQGDITGLDPQLGSLVAGASGPTKAHPPLPLSPIIDAGNPLACVDDQNNLLETDQLGNARPQDGDNDGSARCDIGAYETAYNPPDQIPVNYTFTVDRTSDLSDRNPGDGLCDVSINAGDQCTLRAAIEELNALGPGLNPHRIRFDIPGSGVHTISPSSNLPTIDVPVNINGASQPGASCPTGTEPAHLLIQLDGAQAGSQNIGLKLGSSSSTVTGLVITNFSLAGIVSSAEDHQIHCNIIGLAPDGETPQGNGTGLDLSDGGHQVGDVDDVSKRNVISGNQAEGIKLRGTYHIVVAGNFIGTSDDGLIAAGNGVGLFDQGDGSLVQNNVISGNTTGLILFGAADHEMTGNLIGVAGDRSSPLPNTGHGIDIDSSRQVTIGGPGAVANHIAYNGGSGLKILGYEEITIRFNAIHDNGGLGIDLAPQGVNLNDDQDQDTGPNTLQNFPVLNARPAGFVVDGRLNSTPDTRFTVDVYRSSSCDAADYGEGEAYLQTTWVQTDGAGQVEFELDLRGDLDTGDYVTATATDPDGNTSEFSKCVRVGSRRGLTLTVNQDGDLGDAVPADGVCDTLPNLGGEQCTLRAALQEINALGVVSDSYRIEFDIAAAGVVTITPESPLPPIEVPVEIDGISQRGASCPNAEEPAELKIVLDGSAIPSTASGLVLDEGSSGSYVRGLVIGKFPAFGLRLNSSHNQIACNHIGISPDGVSAMGNGYSGVYVSGLNNWIGRPNSPNWANVISHNGNDGVFVRYTANSTIIAGNRIGTTADGWAPAGNLGSGITVGSEGNLIGGLSGGGNLIGGNGRDGVTIYFANHNTVLSNVIGLGRDGLIPLPNSENGVAIMGASSFNRIGGVDVLPAHLGAVQQGKENSPQAAENGNHIANNGGHGVMIDENETAFGSGNAIRQNDIYNNGGLGIDLGDDGVDENDVGDIDEGVNHRQNGPELMVAPGSQVLEIVLNSLPSTTFEIDLFRNAACDISGYGEGQDWVQSGNLTTDSNGQATLSIDLSGKVPPGTAVTATATHQDTNNSSEFSNCVTLARASLEQIIFLPLIAK